MNSLPIVANIFQPKIKLMKSFDFLALLFIALLCVQCKNKADSLKITEVELCAGDAYETYAFPIGASKEINLDLPSCFVLEVKQGVDSFVGSLTVPSESLEINYGKGFGHGEYVKADTPGQVTVQGDHESFRYRIQDNTLTFTFPDAGPINFRTEQVEYLADLVELFKSLERK